MSTSAQIAANQQNAQLSTGPRSEAGKAISSRNNFRHGFTSRQIFFLPTEDILVRKMAEHLWFSERALRFQNEHLMFGEIEEKKFSLFLRYQTTNDRAFHKCLNELLKLRAERRKEQIGFECGTCKIRAMSSGQVPFGTSFGEANKTLRGEAAA